MRTFFLALACACLAWTGSSQNAGFGKFMGKALMQPGTFSKPLAMPSVSVSGTLAAALPIKVTPVARMPATLYAIGKLEQEGAQLENENYAMQVQLLSQIERVRRPHIQRESRSSDGFIFGGVCGVALGAGIAGLVLRKSRASAPVMSGSSDGCAEVQGKSGPLMQQTRAASVEAREVPSVSIDAASVSYIEDSPLKSIARRNGPSLSRDVTWHIRGVSEQLFGRRTVALAGAGAVLSAIPTVPTIASPPPTASFSSMAAEATRAFEKGDYVQCESLWRSAAEAYPEESLAWANLAVALIINASDDASMELGKAPIGVAKQRLEEALAAIARSKDLGSSDALLLNAQGNALGMLLRWEEARATYAEAVAIAPREFESIPMSNEALTFLQLDDLERAEKLTRDLIRRDPNFVDAQALLATIRFAQADISGAAAEISALCDRPAGQQWCERYSTDNVVLGRWPPRAVDQYRELLRAPAIQFVFRNSRALPGR